MKSALNLLVIDDDEVDRRQLRRALASCGLKYELTEIENAARQLDFGTMNTFDCIFLDYLLPGYNGLSLLRMIRDKGIKTPIVIVTSQGNESIAVELMKAGASDYVVKNEINGPALGKVLRNVLCIAKVVREREEAELALRVSEARLAEAQRMAHLGNLEINVEKNCVYCSSEIYNIFGLDPKGEVGLETLLSHIHEEDRDRVRSYWNDMLGGNAANIDFRINTGGMTKFVNAHGYASRAGDGCIVTVQDITERKLGEQEISKAREEAENSLKVKEVFLANMSHEIRTPMNAILGFTRLLYETELTQEQQSFIDAIQFSGENLLVIINDILDLSKIRSGKLTFEQCDFNIRDLVAGVLSVLMPKAQEKGLQLRGRVDPKVPVVLNGDPVRLNQVLMNLISNAIKFTEKGGVTVGVGIGEKESENVVIEFKVRDTGIGIPPAKQDQIFETFVQGSADTTRRFGGTGLGLTIVKSLVELQNGTISVASNPNRGSEFVVHLPYGKVGGRGAAKSAGATSEAEEWASLRGKVVLLAEDNAVNQLLVRKVLEKRGCHLDVASNGLDAIASIRSKHYDLVLMDIQMPEMDGYQATTYIRSKLQHPLCKIPILAMTAHAFGSDVTRCLSSGMNDYICKPFKPDELCAKIAKWADAPGYDEVNRALRKTG